MIRFTAEYAESLGLMLLADQEGSDLGLPMLALFNTDSGLPRWDDVVIPRVAAKIAELLGALPEDEKRALLREGL